MTLRYIVKHAIQYVYVPKSFKRSPCILFIFQLSPVGAFLQKVYSSAKEVALVFPYFVLLFLILRLTLSLFCFAVKKWISDTVRKIRDHGIEKMGSIFNNTHKHSKVCSCCYACHIAVFYYVDEIDLNEHNYLYLFALLELMITSVMR
jgi:hypothetical protein